MGFWSGLSYKSVRLIKVQNPILAVCYYTLVVAVLSYVIGYAVIYNKGYQEYETLVGTSRIKVKGSAFKNNTIYDATDLALPDLATTHLFITTNEVHTNGQTRGVCEGRHHEGICKCDKGDLDKCCRKGKKTWNGRLTGKCGSSGVYCEVEAWCPVEIHPPKETLEETALVDVKDWTVLVATRVKFPKFNVTRLNTKKIEMGINLFKVSDLFSTTNFTAKDLSTGASVVLQMYYDCDLNLDQEKCNPSVQVLPLLKEDLKHHKDASHGVNFRSVREYVDGTGTLRRDVTKRFGLLLDVELYGRAGKFSVVPLLITIGAGLALTSIATITCDLIMQYFLPQKDHYVDNKYHLVKTADGYANKEDEEQTEGLLNGHDD